MATSQAEFTKTLKHTPLSRARLSGLKSNACAVLANAGTAADVPALAEALADEDPLVRLAAVDALDRVRNPEAGVVT